MCSVSMSIELKGFHKFSYLPQELHNTVVPQLSAREFPGSLPIFGCPKSEDAQVPYIKWHSVCIQPTVTLLSPLTHRYLLHYL